MRLKPYLVCFFHVSFFFFTEYLFTINYRYHDDDDDNERLPICQHQDERSVSGPKVCILGSRTCFGLLNDYLRLDHFHGTEPPRRTATATTPHTTHRHHRHGLETQMCHEYFCFCFCFCFYFFALLKDYLRIDYVSGNLDNDKRPPTPHIRAQVM